MRNMYPEISDEHRQAKKNEEKCPVCHSAAVHGFHRVAQIPVFCNVLWRSPEAARSAPRGDLDLVLCDACGHIFNGAFNPTLMEYGVDYENSLHFSQTFQDFAVRLAGHLIETYDLRGKTVLEIGSGKGDFLKLLCDLGGNEGYGFDPSYEPGKEDRSAAYSRIHLIRDTFNENYRDLSPDLVCSRHTLEHVFTPVNFLTSLRQTIGQRTTSVIYMEVPNVDLILKDLSIWDLIYEHYSYFSEASLGTLLERTGFQIRDLQATYQGQFLSAQAFPTDPASVTHLDTSTDRGDRADYVSRFSDAYAKKINGWENRLAEFATAGKRVIVWGAGSKGIMFLNLLKGAEAVQFVVDINPRKLGMHVSGAGQEIIHPERLREYRPDTIIIMNPIYISEIRSTVRSLGLEPEYLYA